MKFAIPPKKNNNVLNTMTQTTLLSQIMSATLLEYSLSMF